MVSTILRQGSEQRHRRSHPQLHPLPNKRAAALPLNHAHSSRSVERSSIALSATDSRWWFFFDAMHFLARTCNVPDFRLHFFSNGRKVSLLASRLRKHFSRRNDRPMRCLDGPSNWRNPRSTWCACLCPLEGAAAVRGPGTARSYSHSGGVPQKAKLRGIARGTANPETTCSRHWAPSKEIRNALPQHTRKIPPRGLSRLKMAPGT